MLMAIYFFGLTWLFLLAILMLLGVVVLGVLAWVVYRVLKSGQKTAVPSMGVQSTNLDEETHRVEALVAAGKITAQEGAELINALRHLPASK